MKLPQVNIMQSIDEAMLKQVEILKESSFYQNASESYTQLEEWQQSIANGALMLVTIGLPLLFTLIFYSIYASYMNKLENTQQINTLASTIIGQTSQLQSQSGRMFGAEIKSEGELKTKLNSALTSVGIDGTKVRVADFFTDERSGISELSAKVHFQDFSSANIYAFIQRLFIAENYKLREISIEKNSNNQLLNGTLDISYFSKITLEEDESY